MRYRQRKSLERTQMKFTEKDIKAFHAYEKIKVTGKYNMFDPNARRATGLSEPDYLFVLTNFDKLKETVSAAA